MSAEEDLRPTDEPEDLDRTPSSRERERRILDRRIKAFLKSGGKIEQIEPGEGVGIIVKPIASEESQARATKARKKTNRQKKIG